jgi:hypothetical protein
VGRVWPGTGPTSANAVHVCPLLPIAAVGVVSMSDPRSAGEGFLSRLSKTTEDVVRAAAVDAAGKALLAIVHQLFGSIVYMVSTCL